MFRVERTNITFHQLGSFNCLIDTRNAMRRPCFRAVGNFSRLLRRVPNRLSVSWKLQMSICDFALSEARNDRITWFSLATLVPSDFVNSRASWGIWGLMGFLLVVFSSSRYHVSRIIQDLTVVFVLKKKKRKCSWGTKKVSLKYNLATQLYHINISVLYVYLGSLFVFSFSFSLIWVR